jgi:hypothetical protein
LLDVEDGEALEEWDAARLLTPLVSALALVVGHEAVGIDDRGSAFSLAHMAAERQVG